uniref:Uncharacterized protein n=1 Tax=Rangifer tarandus platyrhynchus TaxID=3082113 RepID=A0ACB0EC61_RANTA|nr:unnamed protein product [Rangifer tarandus platyrhynchus]
MPGKPRSVLTSLRHRGWTSGTESSAHESRDTEVETRLGAVAMYFVRPQDGCRQQRKAHLTVGSSCGEIPSGCSPSGRIPVLLTSHQLRNRGETFYFSSWGADPPRDKAVTTPEQRGGLLNIRCSL